MSITIGAQNGHERGRVQYETIVQCVSHYFNSSCCDLSPLSSASTASLRSKMTCIVYTPHDDDQSDGENRSLVG